MVLPAGLVAAFVAVGVAALLENSRATAPSPSGSPERTSDATAGPFIGDHWHATYEATVCGDLQPPPPTWSGGVHTHGDGILHIHPFAESEEGAGARLTKWLEYGGGLLDEDEVRLPGSPTTYANGDECPDGEVGEVQVFVNGERVAEYEDYIPQDGDRIAIVFGPERDFGRRR